MSSAPTPLLNRKLDDEFAYLTNTLPNINLKQGTVSTRQFLSHCSSIAQQLPDGVHVVNLCDNRYLFLVAFCAVLLRGQINLLPPNKNMVTQARLTSLYNDCYLLHDDSVDIDMSCRSVNIQQLDFNVDQEICDAIPCINAQHLAAISFTSGSTGDSKPNLKYWHSLKSSSDINCRHMIPNNNSNTIYQVATVPAQHMWGLETSVFLPLQHNICIADSRPFYPLDIINDLCSMPEPRMLVSTPTHLRSLISSTKNVIQNKTPEQLNVCLILCATSPLTTQLAKETELFFSGEVREVYGCSEVGSMAVKKTAHEHSWKPFKGIEFSYSELGVTVSGDHLSEETLLQDRIKKYDGQRFVLTGRSDDMVDVAGKRGSLAEINQILFKFDGLIDGVVFMPSNQVSIVRLAAIVKLDKEVNKNDLRQHFRKHIDSAFVPRPIIVVDELPREESGKLSKKRVMEIYTCRKVRSAI